jgi:hypothetical protein
MYKWTVENYFGSRALVITDRLDKVICLVETEGNFGAGHTQADADQANRIVRALTLADAVERLIHG